LIYDFPECGGCRTCELACSFYISGDFNIKNSCIRIMENKNKSIGGFLVNFVEDESSCNFKCSYCLDENEPLCLQYCIQSEKLRELILKFVDYKKSS